MKHLTCGFAGQLFSGKDVAADYLADRLNRRGDCGHWVRNGFATSVKRVFADTFDVDMEFIEKWKRIPEPPPGFDRNVRDSLIFIGDGFRSIQSNIWIDLAFRRQQHHQVISDVRYVNEANHIRKLSGLNVLMWRPNFENDLPNASEQQLMPYVNELKGQRPFHEGPLSDPGIPFDVFLVNDGTIDDLHHKVERFVVPSIIRLLERHAAA